MRPSPGQTAFAGAPASAGSGRVPFQHGFDHLVYVRVFEGCNLHCTHCFIPANPKRLELDRLDGLIPAMAKLAKPGQRILLQWHGGEPTLFGPVWLEAAMDRVEAAAAPAGLQILHGIQTNLLTYGPAWADLYHRRFDGRPGVSWDHGIRLMRKGDPSSAAGFESRFWPLYAQALADGLTPWLTVTVTGALVRRFPRPLELFLFLAERGVTHLHLERVTETGMARTHWAEVGLSNRGYSDWMSRALRAYVQWQRSAEGAQPMQISPFDGLLQSLAGLQAGQAKGYGCWSGACDTRFHTYDADGYRRGCTAVTSEAGNSRAAIALDLPEDLREARQRRRVDCAACEFRPVCSSGCLALAFDDGSGECSGGRGLFATAAGLTRLAPLTAAGDPQSTLEKRAAD